WVTSHGISAWQKKKISWRCSPAGPEANVGSQNKNAATLRAMRAKVTQAVPRVGLSSRSGSISLPVGSWLEIGAIMARVRCYASGVLDDIRKKVEAGIGSLSKQGPDELGAAVLGKAREAAEQLSGLAAGMIEWSAAAGERLSGDVRDLVARCVDEMGLVTRKELDGVAKRVARLEKAAAGRGGNA